jgi:hypothetical protein
MRELKPCGTRAAYVRHVGRGEIPDEACVLANREEAGENKRKRVATTPFRLIPHGLGGYKNYDCRCPTCTEAERLNGQNRRRLRGPAPGAALLAAGLNPADPWPPGRRTDEHNGNGSTTSAGRGTSRPTTQAAGDDAGDPLRVGTVDRAPQPPRDADLGEGGGTADGD